MTGRILLLPSNRLQKPGAPPPKFGIADALVRAGFEAEVLDVNAAPRNPAARKPSLYASIDPWRAFTVLLFRRKAKAVVSYYQSGALLILALRRLFAFKPKVVIVDIGDVTNWPMRARIVSYCIVRADAVFCFAADQAEDLRRRYPRATIRVLPQQIDTELFRPGSEEGDYLLSVGDDISRDYETLANAVFDLGVPVTLRTGKAIHHKAVTVAPRGSDADLIALYRGAKIVVVPLHDMCHPGGISTLLEAFACGNAVVACSARGIRDYLHHEENCLTVPCGDAEALRSAVVRLLGDDALRTRLGRAARHYAETELSQDRYARRLSAAIAALPR